MECEGRSVGEVWEREGCGVWGEECGGRERRVWTHCVCHNCVDDFILFSARKRMSVIVRTPDGTIKLFCKGAVSQLKLVVLAEQGTRLILCMVECHLHARTHYQDKERG